LLISSAVICFLSVSIYEGIIRETEKQIKLKLLLQQKEYEYKHNKEITMDIENIRGIKHDMVNHLSVISGFLEYDKNTKAKEYIQNITEPIENFNNHFQVNHSVMASILYAKEILAKKYKIALEIKTDLHDGINIDDIDLTILLSNILDNAIEACEKITTQDKKIKLSIGSKLNYFYIDCINPISKEKIQRKGKRFLTTKKDSLNHGIGLINVQRVVNKYEGDKEIIVTEDEFLIKITLKNQLASK